MPDQPHPLDAAVKIQGDSRYKKPRLARILTNDTYPLYQVRLAEEDAEAIPGRYDTKKATAVVSHSKLILL